MEILMIRKTKETDSMNAWHGDREIVAETLDR